MIVLRQDYTSTANEYSPEHITHTHTRTVAYVVWGAAFILGMRATDIQVSLAVLGALL